MCSTRLSRFLLIVVACASLGAAASDAFAQTQQLDKTLVRKFPEGFCPLDTPQIGTFVTNTGIIQLTISVGLGGQAAKSNGAEIGFSQVLDDISIIEAAAYADDNNTDETNCYFDGPPFVRAFKTNLLLNNPKVPFYESFGPTSSPCPWDETDGATINTALGQLEFGGSGDVASTSVVISGLTPGTQYVVHGRWSAIGFPFALDCSDSEALCMHVTVDDLQAGCVPLPVEKKTWGAVKSLYRN